MKFQLQIFVNGKWQTTDEGDQQGMLVQTGILLRYKGVNARVMQGHRTVLYPAGEQPGWLKGRKAAGR